MTRYKEAYVGKYKIMPTGCGKHIRWVLWAWDDGYGQSIKDVAESVGCFGELLRTKRDYWGQVHEEWGKWDEQLREMLREGGYIEGVDYIMNEAVTFYSKERAWHCVTEYLEHQALAYELVKLSKGK